MTITTKMKRGTRSAAQQGFALIEVLMTALVLAIAAVGIALMLSQGHVFIVAQGDTRVALHLAQAKIEKLTGLGWSAAAADCTLSNGCNQVNTGCADAGASNEPCYNETFSPGTASGLGLGQQTPTSAQLDSQTFRRYTCVRYVQDDNPELPADPVEPPSSWTCPSCTPAVIDSVTGLCTANCNCTKSTKRIKVAVIPTLPDTGDATSRPVDPNRVTLEAVVTPVPRP
jgi:prepilin-type N-terminal cleavage/methylation domain-containing protein